MVQGKPEWGLLLRRGLTKRCPRCGGGHLYDGWFRMKDRCPTCGLLFEREPGFFVGAYVINFAITEGLLLALVMGFVFWKNANPDAGVGGPVVAAIVIGVVAPIAFYPFSRTIWSAIDIGMTPLELAEIVDAADAVVDDEDEDEDAGGDRPGSTAATTATDEVPGPTDTRAETPTEIQPGDQ